MRGWRALQLSARPQSTGARALLPGIVDVGDRRQSARCSVLVRRSGRMSFRMNMTSPGFARPSWRRASASIVAGSSFSRRFSSRSRAFSCLRAATRASSTCACLPGTHRDEESLLANQRVRRQHDRHEQERRIQQPPATRGWRHRGWFPPPERFGSRLSAGCRARREDARLETALAWGSPLYNTFRAEAARKLGSRGIQAVNFRY